MPYNRPPLKIGLSPRFLYKSPLELGFRGKTLQYLEQSIAHWVMSHGALIFMIPSIETGGLIRRGNLSVEDYVEALDGLVLQGGTDVSPRSYGHEPLRPEWQGDIVRDRYEMELLAGFVDVGKPVLGICRGAQLINVAYGGTLWQDVPSMVPAALRHHDPELYDENFHPLRFEPGSLLERIFPRQQSGLIVEGRGEADGVIEAIRWDGPSFVYGMQWHPEFHSGREGLLDCAPILEAFLREARQRKTG